MKMVKMMMVKMVKQMVKIWSYRIYCDIHV